MSTFPEIIDRQNETSRQGETERQAWEKRETSTRKGYGHGKTARKRQAARLAR